MDSHKAILFAVKKHKIEGYGRMEKIKKIKIMVSIFAAVCVSIGLVSIIMVNQNNHKIKASVYMQSDTAVNSEKENENNMISFTDDQYQDDTFEIENMTINGKKVTFPCTWKDISGKDLSGTYEEYENQTFLPQDVLPVSCDNQEFHYNMLLENQTGDTAGLDDMTVKEIKCIRNIDSYGKKSSEKIAGYTIGKATGKDISKNHEPVAQNGAENDRTAPYLASRNEVDYVVELSFLNNVLEGYYIHTEQQKPETEIQ